jgi:hypothetical protein
MSKKHQKKKSNSGPLLSPDDQARLNALLENFSILTPSVMRERLQSPQLAVSFLEKVPPESPEIAALVLAMKEAFPEKEVQKAIRKMLFRLKQRGIRVSENEREDSPGLFEVRTEQPPEPSAYLSPPDGLGNRAVFIGIPKFPAGMDLAMGVVSDEKGVQEFMFGRYSKKRAKEMTEVFFKNVGNLFETSLAHAAAVLESAYHKGKSGPNPTAGDYLELRPWLLDHVSLADKPLIYDLISPESVSETPLTDSQVDKLLAHKWMESWITDPDDLKPLIEEIMKVQQSPIVVSPEQKTGRILDLKESYISKIYTEEKKGLIKRRLEESAYLFEKAGEKDYAVLALKAALSMEERDSEFRTNAFLRHMVEHSLSFYLGSMEEVRKKGIKEESPSKLILS